MKIVLYKRNAAGHPISWSIDNINGLIEVKYGLVGKDLRVERFSPTLKTAAKEIESRINQKRKEGYKKLSEIYDNAPADLSGDNVKLNYLNAYLPKYNTDGEDKEMVMKAKVFEYDKLFAKGTNYLGQYKINGCRCTVRATTEGADVFRPYRLEFFSREGIKWRMDYLEEYLVSIIPDDFIQGMIDGDFILDGEVYLPGHKINEINHFIKDKTCLQHKLLQFWCYDIAVDNIIQRDRTEILLRNFGKFSMPDCSKDAHFNNKNTFVLLPTINVKDDTTAILLRDTAIDIGFEGAILRKADAEYQFGKRNSAMWKFKKIFDGKFKILDIVPEGSRRSSLPIFICKNDINDTTFKCKIRGSFSEQESYLQNKEKYIGLYLFVEYRERSGVDELPFHAVGTYITY